MTNIYDIRIGEFDSIKWVDYDTSLKPYGIDKFISPIRDFFKSLESYCVAECCGIQAFSFLKDDVLEASKNYNGDEILKQLIEVKKQIEVLNEDVLVSSELNQLFAKDVFIQLLSHLINVIRLNLHKVENK